MKIDEDKIQRYADAIVDGDEDVLMADENVLLAVMVAEVFMASKPKPKPGEKVRGLPLSPNFPHEKILDVIMKNSYPAEDLEMSAARVSRAAAELGFQYLSPFSAAITYKIYPHLSNQPLKRKKRTAQNGKHQRNQ